MGEKELEKEPEKRLCDAALKGDVTPLHQLLGEDPVVLDKAALNCEDKNPLHIAAMLGHADFVKANLQVQSAYFLCLARDREGRNPLHLAAIYGRLTVLQVLLDAGFEAAVEKTDGEETILHLCVKYNQLEALKVLVNRLKDTQLPKGRSEDAAYFLCLARDGNGRNPIHLAAMYGRLAVLQELLDAGFQAALEKTDEGGTILHLCVKYNQLEALKMLVDISKDVWFQNAKNEDGMTILHMAIYYRQNQTIKYLLDSSQVWVKQQDAKGRNALSLLRGQENFDTEIESSLTSIGAITGGRDPGEYQVMLKERSNAMMVVLSLIATMAFQAVWVHRVSFEVSVGVRLILAVPHLSLMAEDIVDILQSFNLSNKELQVTEMGGELSLGIKECQAVC
nr:ankyrin repeat and sterile alpha motif domain-containing protein 1B-like [Coffea arabica]